MTALSHLALLGLAKESVIGTYVAPTFFVPFLGASSVEEMYGEIKDETYRANDSMIQGLYQGPGISDWTIDTWAYPDITGHFLRAMIGPDTITAGASTTSSGATIPGATTITVASATGLAALNYIQIDTGPLLEYAQIVSIAGSVLTVTTVTGSTVALTKAHASGVTVISQTLHTFKQASTPHATYSITLYDTNTTLGYAGAVITDLAIKIDPKSAVSLNMKYKAFPGAAQSLPTATYTALTPELGWAWTMVNGGAASTRGLTYDVTLKRAGDPINSSDGTIGPREIFSGPLEVDGTYKAIFENQLDMNLFTNYTQSPVTATLQQPVALGGSAMTFTTSKTGFFKGKRTFSTVYVEADYSLAGLFNVTDGGSIQATLSNFQTTAY